MGTTSVDSLLSCTSTKCKLTYHLAHVFLEHFEEKAVNVVVVCDTDYQPTESHQGTFSHGGWYTHSSACHSEHSRMHLTEAARLVSWQTQTFLILFMDLVGVVRKAWIDSLLSPDENDHIFDTFGHFVEGSISTSTINGRITLSAMPVSVLTLDTYSCKVYAPTTLNSQITMICEIYTSLPRWILSLEGNGLFQN